MNNDDALELNIHDENYIIDNLDLVVNTKVDREDKLYSPNDEITFIISCLNKSNKLICNLLLQEIIPNEVIPIRGNFFKVTSSTGTVTQCNNVVSILIESINPNEEIIANITGKIAE